ncbi:MBL fold metallo-hydrolase [Ornithinibacillus californiensis]|uniref:MBL fold metallo-hydrolase n=1 Tax=Ornithinibacillus californiensis TaxID=161536 RepID=UPI00069E4711|nr:MBL fold metallo-hydrolase [Ornithinibacillus californiensis]
MYKRLLLPVLMAFFLVACGQGVEPDSSEEVKDKKVDIEVTQTEEEVSDAKEVADEQTDSQSDEATQEEKEEKEEPKNVGSLPELQVHYIDVGQADATLLQYGEHNILFDVGDWRGNEVVNYLQSQGVTKLDLVIGSHPDADHIGQLDDVVNAMTVTEVWLSGNDSTSNTFQRGLEAVLESGANYHEPRSGDEFDIGPMNLKVLYPQSATGKSNEESISVLFTYGNVKFLFTGDADTNAEKRMMNAGFTIDADILQLGHHGSSTSSDHSFVNAVSPDVAIYSAGADNSYGHPHREIVSLMNNAGIELYGTDVHGTIIVTTDGKDYSIKTKKDGTVTPKSSETNSGSSSSSGSGTNSDSGSSPNESNEQANSSCVNINTASFEEVQNIKHIGPERAQDLIELRPFSSVKDLTRIKGIGDARIRDIEAEGIACVN